MANGVAALPTIPEGQTAAPAARPWPRPGPAGWMLFILILAFTSSFIDRQILTLLVGPIRADLSISDTEFSLLVGLAFAIFYSFVGLPIARLADRGSRRWIIIIGIVTWSLATAVCGLASTYWQLFAARVAVGVGEATLTPAASSLIADSYPPERRGLAMSVYGTGVYWGSGLALIIGGAIIQSLQATPLVEVPLLGFVASWRTVFFYVGLPGIIIALLMLTVKEPPRRDIAPAAHDGATPAQGVMHFLRDNKPMIAAIYLGFTFLGMVLIGYLTWVPAMLARLWGWEAGRIGMSFGLVVMIAGTAGMIFGGWLSDRLLAAGRQDAAVRAGVYGACAAIPLAVAAPLMPSPILFLIVGSGAIFCLTSTQALPIVAIQAIAPNHVRAQLVAVYFVVGSLLIFSIGPTVIALITDHVFADDAKVGVSLAIASGIFAPIGALTVATALRPYGRAVRALGAATIRPSGDQG